jgi:hypothetical protein
LAGLEQTRIHLQHRLSSERQLAMKVGVFGQVETHSPLGGEKHERRPGAIVRKTCRRRQSVDVKRAAPTEVCAHPLGIQLGIG